MGELLITPDAPHLVREIFDMPLQKINLQEKVPAVVVELVDLAPVVVQVFRVFELYASSEGPEVVVGRPMGFSPL